MRDILITLIVALACGYTFVRPYAGVLLWSWLSYMNPHRLAFGFAYSMPFAQVTAIVLFIAMLFSKEKKMFPINVITVLWLILVFWMGITTLFAYFPEEAMTSYKKVIKIQLISFLTMILITDIDKIKKLLWVIVVSIGYFSVKGGIFTITTGGSYRVWGPAESFIEGNNELAVATLMIIPLMGYLYNVYKIGWIKKGLLAAMPLSFFAALGTQSRGAFLAFGAVAVFFWLKSQKKLLLGIGLGLLTGLMITFMPESWHKRMETIETYEEDASAMGRLNAWEYAFNAANDRIFGVGFDSWSYETFVMYAPNPLDVHAAHSIYFSVLADHGWIGLILFVAIFFLAWQQLKSIIKKCAKNVDLSEISMLAKMLQVSFIAYLVGGAFLSLSYFDLPWHLVCIVVVLNRIVDEQLAVVAAAKNTAPKRELQRY